MPFKNIVKALYSYDSCDDDELSFQEDDILCILECDKEEWWKACLFRDQQMIGFIPTNYVEPVLIDYLFL